MDRQPFPTASHLGQSSQPGVLRADARSLKVIGWVGVTLGVLAAVAAWRAGQGSASPVFLLFAAAALYHVLSTGTIEMDNDTITYQTPLGWYRIAWEEVEAIETSGYALVFYGDDKRLCTSGPVHWSGPDRSAMRSLFRQQVQHYRIPVEKTVNADYRRPRNTRIPRSIWMPAGWARFLARRKPAWASARQSRRRNSQ